MTIIFLVKILIAIFLIRFHSNNNNLYKNPVIATINNYTKHITYPFESIIPKAKKDYSALIAVFLLTLIIFFFLVKANLFSALVNSLILFIFTWLDVLMYSLILVVIGSWLQANPRQTIMEIALSCNRWAVRPLQKILPSFAGLDFSPIVILFSIQIVKKLIVSLIH